MVAIGGALGVGSAPGGIQNVEALLFEVSTYDPLTFIAVPLLLTLVTLVAILIQRGGNARGSAVTFAPE